MKTSNQLSEEPTAHDRVGCDGSGSASRARETLLALANFNSWRRGDETIEMPAPAEIGATIDDAVNLLRKYDALERETRRLRDGLESLAYWSRNRTATRITLRDRIAALLSQNT